MPVPGGASLGFRMSVAGISAAVTATAPNLDQQVLQCHSQPAAPSLRYGAMSTCTLFTAGRSRPPTCSGCRRSALRQAPPRCRRTLP